MTSLEKRQAGLSVGQHSAAARVDAVRILRWRGEMQLDKARHSRYTFSSKCIA